MIKRHSASGAASMTRKITSRLTWNCRPLFGWPLAFTSRKTFIAAPMFASHTAVSLGTVACDLGRQEGFDVPADTLRALAVDLSALLRSILPRRMGLRLSSATTNRIRRHHLIVDDACHASNSFLRGLAAQSDCPLQEKGLPSPVGPFLFVR